MAAIYGYISIKGILITVASGLVVVMLACVGTWSVGRLAKEYPSEL
jgi:hypothetical protein